MLIKIFLYLKIDILIFLINKSKMCSSYSAKKKKSVVVVILTPPKKKKIIHQWCTIVIHKSPVLIPLIAKKISQESKMS